MDYIREAIEQLEHYNELILSLANMRDQLKALKLERYGIKAQIITREPKGTGKSEPDDKWVNNIFERNILVRNIEATNKKICCIDKALSALGNDERLVLKRMFIAGNHNAIEDICRELNLSKSQVYRIKGQAIRRFARAMYGVGVA